MVVKTLEKFGFPNSLVRTYKYWYVLLSPDQSILGSLIMLCREPATSFADLSEAAILEYGMVLKHITQVLCRKFDNDKSKYLMLMISDPAVHFHIIPKHENLVKCTGEIFTDLLYLQPVKMGESIKLGANQRQALLASLIAEFSAISDGKPECSPKKYRRMYTSGCFDIFHQGHLNILKKTKALCDYLIVGVSTDELIIKEKGREAVIPFEERFAIIESIQYVDEVIPQIDKNKQRIVDLYKIDAISVGSDWKGRYPEVSCEMVYFDYTPNVSSTILKEKLNLLKL